MVKYLEELRQLTDRRFNQQAVLEADRLRVQAELAKASYQLAVIQDALADRKESLNHLLGRDLQTAIEEMHEKGEPLERALPDAGIERLRPVMITVGATILALFPLALEGGPLWQPLRYAQIGGLAVATFITLLLVPVFYAIFVLDLKWITWEVAHPSGDKVERKADSPLLGSVSS